MLTASPAPIGILVHASTLADGERWGRVAAERVDVDLRPGGAVDASLRTFDPLWDGPYAQPADPGDWQATRPANATPKLERAVSSLRDAIAGVDLLRAPNETTGAPAYATMHLRFAERPEVGAHLRPYQDRDGSWLVYLRTSLDDLFVHPQLGAVVEAARAVAAAAR